ARLELPGAQRRGLCPGAGARRARGQGAEGAEARPVRRRARQEAPPDELRQRSSRAQGAEAVPQGEGLIAAALLSRSTQGWRAALGRPCPAERARRASGT